MCLDSSWQAVGETRLMCVEGCGCPVPTTHAHCYLNMTATCDVAGDGRRMTRCPGCTHEVAEPMSSVMRKAQHNHDALRRADPAYSNERTAMMHAVVCGATNMIDAAREYHARTRRAAMELAETQGALLAHLHAIIHCVDSGRGAGVVRAAAVAARHLVVGGLRDTVRRMTWEEQWESATRRAASEARVFVDAGLEHPVHGVRHGHGGGG